MSAQTTLEVTENVTEVNASGDTLTITLTDDVTEVQAYTLAVPFEVPGQITANNVTVAHIIPLRLQTCKQFYKD